MNWIKWRTSLETDGRVRMMSARLRTDLDTILGKLSRLWSLADCQADESGELFGWTIAELDSHLRCEGFCEAMPSDWIDLSGEWVKLPQYQEHNGSTAKRRASDAKRKAESRKSPRDVRTTADKMTTREEKRREDNITINKSESTSVSTPSLDSESNLKHEFAPRIEMTKSEIAQLVKEYSKDAVKYYLAHCSDYLRSKKKTTDDGFAYVRKFMREDKHKSEGFFKASGKPERDMSKHASRRPAREVLDQEFGSPSLQVRNLVKSVTREKR